ncbi:IopA [Candidatus Magnetoovum chiemensis]|nr:IopA [Candidatus Magnetoovum chiemensis]
MTLSLISIFLCLLAAEAGIRINQYFKESHRKAQDSRIDKGYEDNDMYNGKFYANPVYEYNAAAGFIPAPSQEKYGYKINKYRLRYSDDFAKQKPRGELRIFITGGSAAWGYGVSQTTMYSSILEGLLNEKSNGSKLRVISAAVNAYTSAQEVYMAENIALPLSADLIIMYTGFNDTIVGCFGRGEKLQSSVFPKEYEKEVKKANRLIEPKYDGYNLKVLWLIDKAIYAYFKAKYKAANWGLNFTPDKEPLPINNVTQMFLRNIRRINELSKKQGAKLIVYLQPILCSTNKKLTDWEKSLIPQYCSGVNNNCPDYFSKAYAEYRAVLPKDAKEQGYIFIDGDNGIKDESKSVFIDICHEGDRGNKLTALDMYKEEKMLRNLF